jgi:hypothetical protein
VRDDGCSPAYASHESLERRLALPPERLTRRCDPADFAFGSTSEVEPLDEAIGQPRALRALEFWLGVPTPGYNLFAAGPAGTGKRRGSP